MFDVKDSSIPTILKLPYSSLESYHRWKVFKLDYAQPRIQPKQASPGAGDPLSNAEVA